MPYTFSVYGIILHTDNKQTLCSTWNGRRIAFTNSFFYPTIRPQKNFSQTPIHLLIINLATYSTNQQLVDNKGPPHQTQILISHKYNTHTQHTPPQTNPTSQQPHNQPLRLNTKIRSTWNNKSNTHINPHQPKKKETA